MPAGHGPDHARAHRCRAARRLDLDALAAVTGLFVAAGDQPDDATPRSEASWPSLRIQPEPESQ